jgi:hypothetical protein
MITLVSCLEKEVLSERSVTLDSATPSQSTVNVNMQREPTVDDLRVRHKSP